MLPEDFYKQMKEILNRYENDEEICHIRMADLMCNVLRNLGYGDGIDIFDEAPKWYA